MSTFMTVAELLHYNYVYYICATGTSTIYIILIWQPIMTETLSLSIRTWRCQKIEFIQMIEFISKQLIWSKQLNSSQLLISHKVYVMYLSLNKTFIRMSNEGNKSCNFFSVIYFIQYLYIYLFLIMNIQMHQWDLSISLRKEDFLGKLPKQQLHVN